MVRYTVTRRKPRGRMYHGPGHPRSAYGLSRYHLTNSFRGIRTAHARGYAQIDLDVMLTKDLVLVVNHAFGAMEKEGFRALGVPRRPIDRLKWSQVRRLRTRGKPKYRIQTLDAMLAYAAAHDLIVALDLKGDRREGFRIATVAQIEEIIRLANKHGVHVYLKADPKKVPLVRALGHARARGVWTRKNGSARFIRPRFA